MNNGRYASSVAAIPTPEIPTARRINGSQQHADATIAETMVPTLVIVVPRLDSAFAGNGVSDSCIFNSSCAILIPLATVPRQQDPEGFSVSQRQPGSLIFA